MTQLDYLTDLRGLNGVFIFLFLKIKIGDLIALFG